MSADVRICRLTFGITMHAWLCAACRAARKAAGWTVELTKTTALYPLDCDDCDLRRQDSGPVPGAHAPALRVGIHRVADAAEETAVATGVGAKEATRPGVALAPEGPGGGS